MDNNKQLSSAYRLMRRMGMNYSEEEYGQISFYKALSKAIKGWRNGLLLKYCMFSAILGPLNYRKIRPVIWRWMGAKIGKGCYIGYEVYLDITHSDMVVLEDHVHIANRCFLLCHQRDLGQYRVGDDYARLKYNIAPITLKRGCLLGTNVTVMPGITVGEGAIIGAGSLVTRDIPAWTIATGRPAKVVKQIPFREEMREQQQNTSAE